MAQAARGRTTPKTPTASGQGPADRPTDLPTPPWRRRTRPVRQPLSQATIVDAALRILDSQGLDAVSMRRVAEELNTGPASLYVYVSGKEELLELVLDRVLGTVDVPEPVPGEWEEQVKGVVRDARDALAAHGDLARASLAVIAAGPNALVISEGLLTILRAARIPDQACAWILDVLMLYLSADAYETALYRSRAENGEDPAVMAQAYLDEVIAALPRDRFPSLVALKPHMVGGDRGARFEFALDILISGLGVVAGRTATE
ncbi:TetR/AcrR family transcriptional regulator C-terminal domain-containing protein [Streptomyces sp. G44]|uniref:TetR/AcrR family transcriptional regulator n=1 Tax=Streptomyces sp. G44 TaxID=2807632 RepID=UPI001960EB23|nr:TetR/AcrR family transcriptional regulator [Streptomyces sp. G44]MBM7169480.1 TetR/AcrR family transcriptional regulator C-terminal domain-containing protein [Streptomyces sp. G44]